VSLLLDSHVFVWWLQDSPRLAASLRAAIAAPRETVFVSAATIWELALKISIGRLRIMEAGEASLDSYIDACGFTELPVRARHAAAAARLPPHHHDPFDRLLIAQANIENMTLATVDKAMARYEVVRFDA